MWSSGLVVGEVTLVPLAPGIRLLDAQRKAQGNAFLGNKERYESVPAQGRGRSLSMVPTRV